jgi:hypothetical protein
LLPNDIQSDLQNCWAYDLTQVLYLQAIAGERFEPPTSWLWDSSPEKLISAYLDYGYEFTVFYERGKMRQNCANCDIPAILGQARKQNTCVRRTIKIFIPSNKLSPVVFQKFVYAFMTDDFITAMWWRFNHILAKKYYHTLVYSLTGNNIHYQTL